MSRESQTSERFYGSREEEISRIVRGLKVAAKNLNCQISAPSKPHTGAELRIVRNANSQNSEPWGLTDRPKGIPDDFDNQGVLHGDASNHSVIEIIR